MIELKNIYKYYNPGTVNEMCLFEDFNLNIEKGEFISHIFRKPCYTLSLYQNVTLIKRYASTDEI